MNDLERKLEELFLSDSRSRRVGKVDVRHRVATGFAPLAFVGGVAAVTLVVIMAVALARGRDGVPATSPTPDVAASPIATTSPAQSAAVSTAPPSRGVLCGPISSFKAATDTAAGSFGIATPATGGRSQVVIPAGTKLPSLAGWNCVRVEARETLVFVEIVPPGTAGYVAEPTPTPTLTPSVASSVMPDARHGVIVATGGLRTEDAERSLQQPSLFATTATSAWAVSPDGKRIALVKRMPSGVEQIVTFTTADPNDITTLVDLTNSGEVAGAIVWAGDGSPSLLFEVEKQSRGPGGGDNLLREYSALRVLDVTSKSVREIARVSGQNTNLWPVAWLPARDLGAALEVRYLGPVTSYVLVHAGKSERTPLVTGRSVTSISASRDGTRVLQSDPTLLRWWPVDQPADVHDLSRPGDSLGHAEFRPGFDEVGVDVGRNFEIWSLTGQRRVVGTSFQGFRFWRVDGSAAIVSSDQSGVFVMDPATGTLMPLPGGAFPAANAVLF